MAQKSNMQAFQVLEPEKKKNEQAQQTQQPKGCMDPRLLTFCITNFVINVGVSQIAPFYPELAANEAGLNFTQIGIVFGVNPLGSIIFSFIIGSMISVWVALILQFTVQILFGCLNYMTYDKNLFFIMSMVTRILQGMSRSVYATVTFAYVPIFWPDEFQKKLGIMESMTALGLLFGPMIGSLLNSLFGYSLPFFTIGTFFLLALFPIFSLMPSDSSLKSFQKKKRLPIGKAFKSVKVVVTIMNIMTITSGYIFFNPFFVNHMSAYGISANWAALILTIPSVFLPRIQKHCKKTFLMSLSLMICFTGNMIEAPFFGITDSITPVIIGLILVGCAQALSMLPSIPQLIEFLTPIINDPTMKAGISDMSSALFIMSMGFGSLIGPLLGGMIYDAFGGNVDAHVEPEVEKQAFKHSLEILGLMQFVTGILFFFFADGYKGWQDLFRRCSTQRQDDSSKPLLENKEEVLSDNDSSSETSEGTGLRTSEKEMQPNQTKTIRIRKENIQ